MSTITIEQFLNDTKMRNTFSKMISSANITFSDLNNDNVQIKDFLLLIDSFYSYHHHCKILFERCEKYTNFYNINHALMVNDLEINFSWDFLKNTEIKLPTIDKELLLKYIHLTEQDIQNIEILFTKENNVDLIEKSEIKKINKVKTK